MDPTRRPNWAAPSVPRLGGREPIGFDAGDNNWYRFVANSPTAQTDPSGTQMIVSGRSSIPTVPQPIGEPQTGDTQSPSIDRDPSLAGRPRHFITPTNPPQLPPAVENIPKGWRINIHPPNEIYPNGHWHLLKPLDDGNWQPVDPKTMKPGPPQDTHIPLPRQSPACPPQTPTIPWWLRLPIMIMPVSPQPPNWGGASYRPPESA